MCRGTVLNEASYTQAASSLWIYALIKNTEQEHPNFWSKINAKIEADVVADPEILFSTKSETISTIRIAKSLY